MGDIVTRAEVQQRAQVSENGPRLATSQVVISTTGWGEKLIADRWDFGCSFATKPNIAYGYALDGDNLTELRYPRAHGGVSSWDSRPDGLYIGAWVFVVVDTISPVDLPDTPLADPNYDIDHFFSATGLAMKIFPEGTFDTQ